MTKEQKVAFVTGANGISGQYVVTQLTTEPHWSRIIATSRRRPQLPNDPRVEFIPADLNVSEDEVVKILREHNVVGVTHFFHMAYIHNYDFWKQHEYNVPFFKNLFGAVEKVNLDTFERIVLQTGGKHYGSFSVAMPTTIITESLGRNPAIGRPNFYYDQEDFIFQLQKGKKWNWTVTRPFMINGFTFGSGQSFAATAGLYFTIQKYLGEPAYFSLVEGTDETSYNKRWDASSAKNIAAFTTYAAMKDGAKDQDYNIVDNDPNGLTFGQIWESIGEYFGIPVATKKGYNVENDVKEKLKRGVWKELVMKHGGDPDACENYGTWDFFQFQLAITFQTWVSMDKARREIGWDVQFDTRKELHAIFDQMKDAGVIPFL